MRVAGVITTLLLMGLAGVVLYDARRMGVGWGTDGPQSGFLPFWLATLLLAVALGVLVQTLSRPATGPFVTAERFRPVLKVLLPVAGFVGLTDPPGPWPGLGLYVAAAVYLGFYMRWVGRHSWRAVVVLSVAVPIVAFVIFEKWFLVPMPKGPLEGWLGY